RPEEVLSQNESEEMVPLLIPAKPATLLRLAWLFRPAVTSPVLLDCVMVPLLIATNPPKACPLLSWALTAVTLPRAADWLIVAPALLLPTRPPTSVKPVTLPEAEVRWMVPKLKPTSPPSQVRPTSVPLTLPLAPESRMVLELLFMPTSPP